MRRIIADIFESIGEAPDDELKVMRLQDNNSEILKKLLSYALDKSYVFDVKIPSYKENQEVDGFASNNLYVEQRRLYLFLNTTTNVNPKKKSVLLAQILETIDPKDAVLVEKIIKKDLSEYGITAQLVNEAFPGLIKNV